MSKGSSLDWPLEHEIRFHMGPVFPKLWNSLHTATVWPYSQTDTMPFHPLVVTTSPLPLGKQS